MSSAAQLVVLQGVPVSWPWLLRTVADHRLGPCSILAGVAAIVPPTPFSLYGRLDG